MNREYHKWFSPNLKKEMELLIFGHRGASVLFFPTRAAHFYDYEDWHVIDAVRDRIEAGFLQIYCLDSNDKESFYCSECDPAYKVKRHLHYERYVLEEVIPLKNAKNANPCLISAGCSMGAYHAVNIAFKYPKLFSKALGMSGRYDLTKQIGIFPDLFSGYRDEDIYFNMPSYYMPNLTDGTILSQLRRLEITLVVGREDAFLENNQQLSAILTSKGINNNLFIWDAEAHKPWNWAEMLPLYL